MPKKTDSKQAVVHLDGRELMAGKDQTILELARGNAIHIPTLCFHPALPPSGSCRLCAVAVEGASGRTTVMLSCVLKAKPGMVVRTRGEDVQDARAKALVRLIQMAPQSQRLHRLAQEEQIALPPAPDGCIRCRLCIRVCKEIVGQAALRMEKHAGRMRVVPDTSRCIGCGTCANLCPTHIIEVRDQGQLRTVRLGDVVFGRQPLERCEGCGKYYATEKQVHLAEKRTGPHPQVKLHHHYCPTCAKLFSDRMQVMKIRPPKR
jgi:predicted molibdopterin-dependent oxidoreductase YjgC